VADALIISHVFLSWYEDRKIEDRKIEDRKIEDRRQEEGGTWLMVNG
jgi:hypothetical protein